MTLKHEFDKNKLMNNYNNIFTEYESEGYTEKGIDLPSSENAFYLPNKAAI